MHITLILTVTIIALSLHSSRLPTVTGDKLTYSVVNTPKGCNECGSPRPRPGLQYD